MRTSLYVLALTAVVALPLSALVADAADAQSRERAYKYKRYGYKSQKYRDNPYAARAQSLDPAGDYKGYPDWARVALSPKFDGGGNRR
jgi:hypothetical protein